MKIPKVPNKLPKVLPRNPAALPAKMRRTSKFTSRNEKRSGEKVDYLNSPSDDCAWCNGSGKQYVLGLAEHCSNCWIPDPEVCEFCEHDTLYCTCEE